MMLHLRSRLLRGHLTSWSHTGPSPRRCFSVGHSYRRHRDYSLPNATWSRHTQELYRKYEELSRIAAWRRIPSYDSTVHYVGEGPPKEGRVTRLFTRNQVQDGVGFEYSMFYNAAEKRMVCIFQPGDYLEGPPGYTHGGCIATILDITFGSGAMYICGKVMTANLNVNYLNPVPLGSTVIVDSHVEKVEGRKVYTRGQVRSHDDQILHSEGTGLFIKLNILEAECSTN